MARHLFVVTGVGLVLVTLMVLFPALRVGAEAVSALLGPEAGAALTEPGLEVRDALQPVERQPLSGKLAYEARSLVGVPLERVQVRSGDEPWRPRDLDGRGGWNQERDDALEVRAPGHWPARANPGTREFVLEPQWALVVQLPAEAAADSITALLDSDATKRHHLRPALHGPSRLEPDAYVFAVGGADPARGGPAHVSYTLRSELPVDLRVELDVDGEGTFRADLRPLLAALPVRTLRVTGLCPHADQPLDVWVVQQSIQHRESQTFSWGSAATWACVGTREQRGRVGEALETALVAMTAEASVGVRCAKGCYGTELASSGSRDSTVRVRMSSPKRVHGRLRSMVSDLVPRTTTVRVEYSEVWQKDTAAGRSPWGFTRTIDVAADGAFELALAGRPPTPRALDTVRPVHARLTFDAPGFHDGSRWVDLTGARTHFLGNVQLYERRPVLTLAAGHGVAPDDPPGSLEALGVRVRIDEVAPAQDGRLFLYGEHEDEAEMRKRLADVRELLLDPRRRPTAWVRGADGDFVRVTAREAPLVVRCETLPEAPLDRAAFGWTWRGLHAAEGVVGPEQLGVELRTPAAIPDDATELWWGAAIGPPENSFAFGGAVPYARELEALTIR